MLRVGFPHQYSVQLTVKYQFVSCFSSLGMTCLFPTFPHLLDCTANAEFADSLDYLSCLLFRSLTQSNLSYLYGVDFIEQGVSQRFPAYLSCLLYLNFF